MNHHKMYSSPRFTQQRPIAPKEVNGQSRPQGPPRPLSQTSTVSSQRTPRSHMPASQPNTDVNPQAPVNPPAPRLEPQQPAVPSLPTASLALPSSLVSYSKEAMGDMANHSMGGMDDMGDVDTMEEYAHDAQQTHEAPPASLSWWQAYRRCEEEQVLSERRVDKVDDKARRNGRQIRDLERRVTELERQLRHR
ncbi:hypothetical protein FSOLCH5_15557 [Fusarium solani]